MKYTVSFLLLLFVANAWAQDETRRELKGKITSSISGLDGIYVINQQTENAILSKEGGYFSIMAKVGDTLMFSSIQFKGKLVTLKEKDFSEELFFVRLEPMIHQLDEVIINGQDNINAVTLGIISPNIKRYTPAERKLKAADGSSNLYGLNTQVSFDGILNGISGRTAMLRKEVAIEKKETMMEKLEDWFDEKYFIDQLKIPVEYVKGFLFYIVENDRFASVLKAKNKDLAKFMMSEMAVRYKDTIACETEK